MEKMRFSIKKMLAVFAAVFMIAGTATPAVPVVTAASKSVNVKLTLSLKGEFAKAKNGKYMAQMDIKVTDLNKNGRLDVDDVLIQAHKKFNKAGGYSAELPKGAKEGKWVTKVWGQAKPIFSFYLDGEYSQKYVDQAVVRNGSKIVAFTYLDESGWSDSLSSFDVETKNTYVNNDTTLTLKAVGWDGSFSPVEDASLKLINTKTKKVTALNKKTGADGKVTFKAPAKGTYIVSAFKASNPAIIPPVCTLKVTEKKASKVTVTGSSSMSLGDEQKLTATITPANASFKDVTWKSSNTKIAKVDKTGKVTAGKTKTGKVTITARVKGKSGKLKINVKYAPFKSATAMVTKINGKPAAGGVDVFGTTIDPEKAGTTLQYSVNLQPKTTDTRLKWSSSNKKVAKVSNNGLVTIKGEGKAKITVKQKSGKEVGSFTVQGVKKK